MHKPNWAIGAIALMTLSSQVDTQPFRNLGGWHAVLRHADSVGRNHRVYDLPHELTVSLSMSNESGMDLAVDYPRLPGRVRFSVTGAEDIPVVATWPANAGPNQLGWTIVLTRKDGQAFSAGKYKIDISVRAVYELMRTPSGKPLRGIEHQSTGLFVLIKEPANAREQSAAYRLLGKRTLAEDASEGLRLLVLATHADPTDLGALLDLAQAYVKTGRCRDAIPIFERAVQRSKDRPAGRHNTFPYLLAHAYVCVGNEQRAAQVLREGGVSEERLKDTIARFRKTVPK